MLICSIDSFNDIWIFVILQILKFYLKLNFSFEYKRENALDLRYFTQASTICLKTAVCLRSNNPENFNNFLRQKITHDLLDFKFTKRSGLMKILQIFLE